jgi:hypothetical protein
VPVAWHGHQVIDKKGFLAATATPPSQVQQIRWLKNRQYFRYA